MPDGGEATFSRSESLWLARGGTLKLHESNVLHVMWHTEAVMMAKQN
jgi:hypothetical protein